MKNQDFNIYEVKSEKAQKPAEVVNADNPEKDSAEKVNGAPTEKNDSNVQAPQNVYADRSNTYAYAEGSGSYSQSGYYYDMVEKQRRKRRAATPLVLSLLGLLLSPFYGAGILLSILGFAISGARRKEGVSQTNSWAFFVGLAGMLLNVMFILIFVSAILLEMTV